MDRKRHRDTPEQDASGPRRAPLGLPRERKAVPPPSSSAASLAARGTGLRPLSAARANVVSGAGVGPSPTSKIPGNAGGKRSVADSSAQGAVDEAIAVCARDMAMWVAKDQVIEAQLVYHAELYEQMEQEASTVADAVEDMMARNEEELREVQRTTDRLIESHQSRVAECGVKRDECRDKQNELERNIKRLEEEETQIAEASERTKEQIIVLTEELEAAQAELQQEKVATAEVRAAVHHVEVEYAELSEASLALDTEAGQIADRIAQLGSSRERALREAAESEMERRRLFSLHEELKGTIRVYCRVRNDPSALLDVEMDCAQNAATCRSTPVGVEPGETDLGSPRREGSVADDSPLLGTEGTDYSDTISPSPQARALPPRDHRRNAHSPLRAAGAVNGDLRQRTVPFAARSPPPLRSAVKRGGGGETAVVAAGRCGSGSSASSEARPRMLFPDAKGDRRMLLLTQRRANATSTGSHSSSEAFTFDRVYSPKAPQSEVFADVGPLVDCAVDGYRVCIFAYGQTGSGKTHTMEGDVTSEELKGITPRAIERIFDRQAALRDDGWTYTVTCTFVEIYNESLRDLLCSPTAYEAGGAASQPHYHTIKHQVERAGSQGAADDTVYRTVISNVSEKVVHSIADFQRWLRLSIKHRTTAKTQLNDRSSRSHCVCTLRIDGENHSIRQRSEGILCLVDLAGSERPNDAGSQGQQFREAVNINRSLLDLGKCIYALSEGAVIPWRNSKLTYLLQHYLGAKGAKMLMLVTVSSREEHIPESLNSLRFATRVNQTYVGASKKRLTSL